MIGECISTTLFILIQVIVSGKLRAQRAKSMKFKDGYMISSGQPVNEYIDSAVRHVLLRQVCFSVIVVMFVYLLSRQLIFHVVQM
jgi:small subunit ribosomal protein S3e